MNFRWYEEGLFSNRILVFSIAILLIGATIVGLYLFRKETIDNPKLGLMRYSFSWGHLATIECDVNRDGQIDSRARIQSLDNKVGSTGFTILEGWESSQMNGYFDVHYVREQSGILVVDVDSNGDGEMDIQLVGPEAESYFGNRTAPPWLTSGP